MSSDVEETWTRFWRFRVERFAGEFWSVAACFRFGNNKFACRGFDDFEPGSKLPWNFGGRNTQLIVIRVLEVVEKEAILGAFERMVEVAASRAGRRVTQALARKMHSEQSPLPATN
jgi:hypothetical protein